MTDRYVGFDVEFSDKKFSRKKTIEAIRMIHKVLVAIPVGDRCLVVLEDPVRDDDGRLWIDTISRFKYVKSVAGIINEYNVSEVIDYENRVSREVFRFIDKLPIQEITARSAALARARAKLATAVLEALKKRRS